VIRRWWAFLIFCASLWCFPRAEASFPKRTPADRYADFTFARTNNALSGTANPFTIIAQSTNGLNVTNTATYHLPASISLAYDANGNLTNDGLRNFSYDFESRLTTNWVTDAWKTEFVYDGLGRRRITRDYGWQSGNWVKTNEVRHLYDGLLPIQERDANNIILVTYTRGLDLSGSLDEAGGIGGLLARTDANGSAFYHSDGSGNITALMDVNGDIVARYLYNPFGKLVGKWGPLADVNVMRFSSKEHHANSGLYYYGFRFYDPNLQRWLNHDPLGEAGGINLYQFVYNSPLNYVDPDGLTGWALYPPQGWSDPSIPAMIQSPEYQQGFQEGAGQAALMGLAIASLFTPIPGDEAGIASLLAGRLGKLFCKAKPKPRWPKTPDEMDDFLKVPGKRIPDKPSTPGRDKVEWRPNKDTKITYEQHPYHPNAPDWHKGPHYHLDTPGIPPHQRYVPGDPIPGY